MNIERYEYTASESLLDYEFYSIGPKGNIRKRVSFDLYELDQLTFYSLIFGNYVEGTGEIDILAVSDNKDTEKSLVTVFTILIEFTSHFPGKLVYAIGSSEARTRLYQINIVKHWDTIEPLLLVYGEHEGEWEPFNNNTRYKSFLFKKK